MVRSILVEMTSPFRMAPRMVTSEVNGHFLSTYFPLSGGLDAQTNVGVPALVGLLAQEVDLAVRELILLLESSLVLQ